MSFILLDITWFLNIFQCTMNYLFVLIKLYSTLRLSKTNSQMQTYCHICENNPTTPLTIHSLPKHTPDQSSTISAWGQTFWPSSSAPWAWAWLGGPVLSTKRLHLVGYQCYRVAKRISLLLLEQGGIPGAKICGKHFDYKF